jgi:hypothetical protein
MVGGTGQNELIADPELIMQAKKELQGSVIDEGVISNRLAEELPEDFIKLPLQIPASIPVITVESNHSDGVHVVARRSITIAMVKKKQLAQIIAKNMGADTDRQMTLDSFEGMTVVAGSLGTLPNQTKELPLRITGQAIIYGFVDTDSIKANILEKTKKQTKEFLANSKEIDSVTIRMTPPWRNVMPKDSKNISFLIKKGVN